ncbi:MAG: thioredoxin domain-containing protein [Ardenticatenales bacterium]
MKTSALLALVAMLLMAPTACGGSGADKQEATDADGTATALAAAPITATVGVSGTLAADIGDAASADADGTPLPTPNATVEKLAETFTLPETGDADAPLLILEFSDYRCPFCKQFFDETLPDVRKNWIDTGKVRLQFYDLPLTNHGYPAVIGAELAHCAGEQGEYWAMHDVLYEAFDALTDVVDLKDEEKSITDMLKAGEKAGLDNDKLKECVESKRYRPIVAELASTALEKEINGTPWFILIAGEHAESIPGYVDYKTMLPLLEREYSRALGTPIPTDTAAPATPTPAVTATTEPTVKP